MTDGTSSCCPLDLTWLNMKLLWLAAGLLAGAILTGLAVYLLMPGKMFGGNIAKVMGEAVAAEEREILNSVIKG